MEYGLKDTFGPLQVLSHAFWTHQHPHSLSMVNDVLRDFLNRFVFVYLDNILIFSRSLDELITHFRQVLQRLLENRLYVKAKKCKFHVPSVTFLGFVKAVVEWPAPCFLKQLQRCFLKQL